MLRRHFIGLLGGAAAAWPLAARGQPAERMRRIGVMMNYSEDDPEARARLAAFLKALEGLGWIEGRNIRLDYRWSIGDSERQRANAAELVALAPDVILAATSATLRPLKRATRTVPIVFVTVADPVSAGLVASLARPGGNATGFTNSDFATSGKWLELLKEIAPSLRRVAVLGDPEQLSWAARLGAIHSVAQQLQVELSPIDVHDPGETERAVAAFARQPNGGMIVVGSLAQIRRDFIVGLAARNKLPAVYSLRLYVASGGLASYGVDSIDQYRRAAGYVDRIFKGEKPADLPVQAPTKYELALNLKTARALGLAIPESVQLRADQIIE